MPILLPVEVDGLRRTTFFCCVMAVPDLFSLFSLLALALLASGHGYVNQVSIDGQLYEGNPPGRWQNASVIRLVSSVNPVQNTSDPNLACGLGAQPAQLDATAAPGSAVTFSWVAGSGGHWFHETGPILTYLASCGAGSTSCSTFNTSGARWFKIDEAGKQGDNTTWVQQDLDNGANYTVNLPGCLAPGAASRTQIISLQNAMSKGGAEFYISCTQLQVPGDGTCVPAPNETVSFPGAYDPTDPGILIDVYTDRDAAYVFPGPPVATLVPQSAAADPSAGPAPAADAQPAQPADAAQT
ncbi:glycosyl hydrolase family 61-domain-containing protein, partial [Amylocystis lapponica]